jgi:large subunit ribosomal protein L13Ae
MVLTATRVIDGRDHLLGRLASVVAKELLAGQSIVIVRCDEMCISGSRKHQRVSRSCCHHGHISQIV